MEKSIEQLKKTLQQELKMYEDILEMAKEKTVSLKMGNLKKIEEITQKEQEYIKGMATFEKIRRSIFVNISNEMAIPQPNNLSELLLHLEEKEVEKIDQIRNQLLDTIQKLTEVNKLNEKLINQNLEIINFNLQLMTSTIEMENNYTPIDKTPKKTTSSLLDVKI